MDSNQKPCRKSDGVIFPARNRCHSNQPQGRGQFAHMSGGSGDLFTASVLDLMGADGAFAVVMCVSTAAA